MVGIRFLSGWLVIRNEEGAIKEGLAYVLMALFVLTVGLGIAASAKSNQAAIWDVFWDKLKAMFDKISV